MLFSTECCNYLIGNIRNLAMEKVASSVLFPCRYVSNGCNATMAHTDKSGHEDGCEFRSDFAVTVSV